MAGVAEGPHGGSMGVSGPGTPGMGMGDPGSSAQKGYDYGFEGAASDTSTMEGFRAALARALGQVTQGQKDAAVEAQNNLDANNRAMAAAVEARDKTQREAKAQKEREALMSQLDALMGQTNFATPTDAVENTNPQTAIEDPSFSTPQSALDAAALAAKNAQMQGHLSKHNTGSSYGPAPANAVESPGQPQNPYDFEDVDVVIDDSYFDEDETGLVNPNFNFGDAHGSPSPTAGAYSGGWADVQTETDADPTAFREDEEALMGTTLENIARTDKEKDVSKNRTKNLESSKALMEEFEQVENEIKDLENIPFKERTLAQHTKLGRLRTALNEAKNTTRYRTAYATVYGMSTLGKAILSLAPLGMGWWGPKLSQLAIDNGFIDTSTMADIARDIENSVNKSEPMPNALKKFFVEAEPWAKELTNKQIKYYLDRPEELEWVRNLWSSMNPTQEESMVIID